MAKTVTTIPATKSRFTDLPLSSPIKRKVAAYARVSTDHEEQQSSYDAQVSYYTEYIQSRSDWEFAGIFADEGISGCSIKGRQGFQSMIEKALNGDINLIITKSVSRFARNTVDSLSTIRKLKEHNVECYFEKENIWTFDSKGKSGKPLSPVPPFGYQKSPTDKNQWVIDEPAGGCAPCTRSVSGKNHYPQLKGCGGKAPQRGVGAKPP